VLWAALLESKVRTLKHDWQQEESSEAQYEADRNLLKNFDYDVILGDVGVLSDIPGVLFWDELLTHYPDAPVIVNQRELKSWFKSFKTVAGQVTVWSPERIILEVLHRFDTRLFWWYRTISMCLNIMCKFGGLDDNGMEFAAGHYDNIKKRLAEEKRPHLVWEVQHGWEPLCRYLRVDVPKNTPFPRGNAIGGEYEANVKQVRDPMFQRAIARLLATVAAVAAVGWAISTRL
jgi:hypothetical protein